MPTNPTPVEDAAYSHSLEREHWGNPNKCKRYIRVEAREQYRKNLEESNIGRDVNPALGRKWHKVYSYVKKDM